MRLALLQGQAGTPSGLFQLPGRASRPASSLLQRKAASYRAYLLPIECFPFVFAAASAKRGVGGPRNWTSRAGALPGQGTSTLGLASAVSPCPFPKSAHRIVSVPAAANSYILGLPPLTETLHASPLFPEDQAYPKLLGRTHEPLRSLASAAPLSSRGSILSSPQDSPLPQLQLTGCLNSSPCTQHKPRAHP